MTLGWLYPRAPLHSSSRLANRTCRHSRQGVLFMNNPPPRLSLSDLDSGGYYTVSEQLDRPATYLRLHWEPLRAGLCRTRAPARGLRLFRRVADGARHASRAAE